MTADLRIRDLSVRLGGRPVLSGVSLELRSGSFVAVVGPNGAGKTSLLRAIAGLVPHAGLIALGAENLDRLSARARARRIAYLPQGHEMHWPLPARDVVALGRFPHGAADPDRLGEADREAVAEAMRVTDTEAFADRAVTELSGGERARVALARVFAAGAPVILADEPTAALDPRHQIDVMSALRARARCGTLVIAVTHDLGLAARHADAVAVLEAGRLAAVGPPAEALAPDCLRRVFGIEAFIGTHQGAPVLVPWS
ncbi:ABC transporter ATP-binding protein [Enterovirga aerilata]|uniref:ABC transporter ATP-binding protein n=1 Tax=Enterovirga aerilata TaxID=2730920 RepID=A0A849I8X0_9HYPH|nr:ABC transporter ATP-binding protein [Enterovirga sp. DB1703]NNM72859.1 ABC transporter ATP-binding protein [Enterovirga sp. DB1703]